MKEEPTDARVAEIKTLHAQWIQNPTTQMALKALRLHQQRHREAAESNAINITIPDVAARQSCVASHNIGLVVSVLSDPELFSKLVIQTYK